MITLILVRYQRFAWACFVYLSELVVISMGCVSSRCGRRGGRLGHHQVGPSSLGGRPILFILFRDYSYVPPAVRQSLSAEYAA
jgi:hypothetical protein